MISLPEASHPPGEQRGALDLSTILRPTRVCSGIRPASKKALLEQLANLLTDGEENLCAHQALDSMAARERLGSTGLGGGIALPHARLDGCRRFIGAFAHLAQPLEYDTPDQQPVDLAFALLLPPGEHPEYVQTLAAIVERLRDKAFCQELRNTARHHPEQVYSLLVRPPA